MVYNQTLALSELPDQPLIQIEIADAVFVTIWFISSVVFSITLDLLVSSKRQNPTWPEFKTIRTGTWILALWYLLMVVDRWMCFDKVAVKYSYVVFLPIREVPRVASTVLLLWGTYLVVWKELEDKFSRPFQKAMWFAAKCGIFIMSLLSIFYVVLDLALSITWLDFVNVTVINGIASKRTSFEVAMNAFYMLFSLLTLAEAVYALTLQTVRVHGTAQRTRVFLLVAATLIFLKSLIAFGIVADVANKPEPTRRDMRLRADVADGLVAFFYLAVMCWMARMAASPFDPQGGDARLVASDVRRYVLRLLEERTNGARTGAPPFEKILREVEEKIDDLLAEGPFSQHLDVDAPYKRNVVLGCVEQMRSEFGGYGGNAEFTPRRPSPFDFTTQFSLGRKGGKSQLAASSVTLVDTSSRAPPGNTGTRAAGRSPSANTNAVPPRASTHRESRASTTREFPIPQYHPPPSTTPDTRSPLRQLSPPRQQPSSDGPRTRRFTPYRPTRPLPSFGTDFRSAEASTSTTPSANASSSQTRSSSGFASPGFTSPASQQYEPSASPSYPPPQTTDTFSIGGYNLPVARRVALPLDEDDAV